MKKGFTLAEVLITLGIVGIIAALTIPQLMSGYRKKVVETKLQKAVSMLNQAILLSSVQNGTPDEWELGNTSGDVILTYIAPYIDVATTCKKTNISDSKDICCNKIYGFKGNISGFAPIPKYILKNGISITFAGGGTGRLSQRRGVFTIYLDNNNKNIYGKNVFTVNLIVEDNKKYFVTGTLDYSKNSFCNMSRNALLDMCENGASNTTGGGQGYSRALACSALIECNGWKIPKDYPVKI